MYESVDNYCTKHGQTMYDLYTRGVKNDLFLRGPKGLRRSLSHGVLFSFHFGGAKISMFISIPQPGNADSGFFGR